MKFPTAWPSDCPPRDAVDANGGVYRLVNDDPPSIADLASHQETGRLLVPPLSPAVRPVGVSGGSPEDAVHANDNSSRNLGG